MSSREVSLLSVTILLLGARMALAEPVPAITPAPSQEVNVAPEPAPAGVLVREPEAQAKQPEAPAKQPEVQAKLPALQVTQVKESDAQAKQPDGQMKEPDAKVEDKGGDTYNFYFQKAPGANKVEQGETQTVEQAPISESARKMKKPRTRVADLFIGPVFLPGKTASGLTVGGDFLPGSIVGVRLGIFGAQGSTETNSNTSTTDSTGFSRYGTKETTTTNEIFGGDLGLTLNILSGSKAKVAPMFGVLFPNDKTTTTVHTFGEWNDKSTSESSFHILPYVGMSGTVYFSKRVGMNAAVFFPGDRKYINTSLNFVLSI